MALTHSFVLVVAICQLAAASVVRRDLAVPSDLPTGWSYTGCYVDDPGNRALNGNTYRDQNAMTSKSCISFCATAGYSYAGTEYSVECYCSKTAPTKSVASSDCNMACSGDSTQPCGAGNRLTVFHGPPNPPKAIPGWTYVGCRSEGTSGRTLGYTAQVAGGSAAMTNELCTSACSSAGYSIAGTEYSGECYCGNSYANGGLAADDGCTMKCNGDQTEICGGPNRLSGWTLSVSSASARPSSSSSSSSTTRPATSTSTSRSLSAVATTKTTTTTSSSSSSSSASTSSTTTKTTTTSSSSAGVSTSSTTTKTTTTTPSSSSAGASTSSTTTTSTSTAASSLPSGWSYKGCYIDPPGRAMPAANGSPFSSNTVESCIAACSAAGKSIAGMEYGTECYCDNGLNNGASLTAQTDCSMACAGDSTEKCGAGNRLSVYSTQSNLTVFAVPTPKTTGLPGSWQYSGCILDNTNPRILPWLFEDQTGMTIDQCLTQCGKFGYPAGGVEYGYQCLCGDISDVTNAGDVTRPESDCNQPCPGDRTHLCGSGNRISYYKWTGSPLTQWSYASGAAAGQYSVFSTSPIIPLISSVGINEKVIFVEKHGTSQDNTQGSFEFDYATNTYRELALQTDVFCSASLTLPDRAGRQLNIGGWSAESLYGVRLFTADSPQGVNNGTNAWEENFGALALLDPRWYPTAMVLANGSILVMGGEAGSDAPITPSCEILPRPPGVTKSLYLDYLARADALNRRNSYPFTAVLPSGGIFFSQFNESRILSPTDFSTRQMLPAMPGAVDNPLTGRNYPLQGSMMLLPQYAPFTAPLGILVCGGTTAEPGNLALDNCVTLQPEVAGAQWAIERMPSVRVVSCMVALPDGRYLILNGAKQGRAGFGLAKFPNLNAVLYDPSRPAGRRMTVMANTTIARMYHSEAVLLSDGRVLVSGSDPQDPAYPQEHRLEYFTPDYILSGAARPTFSIANRDWAYGQTVPFSLTSSTGGSGVRVSLIAAIGSTHGNSMGQRTLFPAVSCSGSSCTVTAPPNANVSPPAWYQMFVLDGPTPSRAVWVRIGGDPARLGNWPKLPGFTTPGV